MSRLIAEVLGHRDRHVTGRADGTANRVFAELLDGCGQGEDILVRPARSRVDPRNRRLSSSDRAGLVDHHRVDLT